MQIYAETFCDVRCWVVHTGAVQEWRIVQFLDAQAIVKRNAELMIFTYSHFPVGRRRNNKRDGKYGLNFVSVKLLNRQETPGFVPCISLTMLLIQHIRRRS